MSRVAVIGGGLAGVVAALDLAESGVDVDLYERGPRILRGASYWCEGKVHLGYVYALDTSLRTAAAMVAGASTFATVLGRWVGQDALARATSPPFVYAVPRDSMASLDEVERHFAAVGSLVRAHPSAVRHPDRPPWQRMADAEVDSLFDTSRISAAYCTNEVAVDPFVVAEHLEAAVAGCDRLTVHMDRRVTSLDHASGGMTVCGRGAEGPVTAWYDGVVNASWEDRIALDTTAGLTTDRAVLHRFKAGITAPVSVPGLPTCTFLVGEYGDTVVFADRAYASWYPAGLLATVSDLAPPSGDTVLASVPVSDLAERTVTGLSTLLRRSDDLEKLLSEPEPSGGWITAWGRTGIDDPRSQLHQRYEVGVQVSGVLVSIDTGKYTLAPGAGVAAAERMRVALGRRR